MTLLSDVGIRTEEIALVVITDITVGADQFALGRLFESFPEIEIEVERVVPTHTSLVPLFWVSGADPPAVEETLREDPLVEDVRVLTTADDRTLFAVDWNPAVDHLLGPLIEHQGDVLRAEGGADSWEFRIQFHDRAALRAFRDGCAAHDVVIGFQRLYDPSPPSDDLLITDTQREALVAAHEGGYWSVPRGITVSELAGRLGISPQAVSERLRRGTERLVGEYVVPDEEELSGTR